MWKLLGGFSPYSPCPVRSDSSDASSASSARALSVSPSAAAMKMSTAALVDAGRILGQHALEQVQSIEVRRGARIGNRSRGEESLGHRRRGAVERMEPARPPLAL